jgi:hypothetical protein
MISENKKEIIKKMEANFLVTFNLLNFFDRLVWQLSVFELFITILGMSR